MLNVGLYFLRLVGSYKIYTEFVLGVLSENYHLFYLTLNIDLCL